MARRLMNLLVNELHDRALDRQAREHLSGTILDIGCGIAPYRRMLAPYVSRHIGLDHPSSLHGAAAVDVAAEAYAIPFSDESFDGAICTAVLEHLEEPVRAACECRRVLRPGGVAIYTVPFIWHPHEEPRDFYRFTAHGLRHVMTQAGFDVLQVMPLAGFWVTFGQLFVYYLSRFERGPIRFLRLLVPVYLLVQMVALVLDRIDRAEQWTWAYLVVVQRPKASTGGPSAG